ncbi:MAG TPA: MarR family transcriptional regulator [Firmicutes bacterium]|nr:MarR family transcriptional regulator [Bacillota bacterium]
MDEKIITTIFKLDNMLRRVNNRVAAVLGATQQQWAILNILNEAGPNGLPLSDIGAHLDVTKGNVTGLIDRMERDELTKRKGDTTDRRVVLASITPRGKKVLNEIKPIRDEITKRIFQGFSAKDKKEFVAYLDRLVERLADLES